MIKLAKCEEKQRSKQDNIMFQQDQKEFFRTLEGEEGHEGEMPGMESLSSFGEVSGRGKNPIYVMDGRDKNTTE